MADIIDFSQFAQAADLTSMDRAQLAAYLETVQTQVAQLDEQEPGNMASEAYEVWGDRHEELEDLADEIQDRLDDLGAPHD